MFFKILSTLLIMVVVAFSTTAMAQNDPIGKIDTVTIKVEKLGAKQWMISAHIWNDEELAAIDIPIKFSAGVAKVNVDSIVFAGTRIEYFAQKYSPIDTANQMMHFGGLAYMGPDRPPLAPGNGEVARIYFTAKGDKEPGVFAVDTTFFPPNSTLMLVDANAKSIYPALKIIMPEKAKKDN